MAAVGHHLGGLTGARLMAVLISMVTLVAFAKTAETLFGESAAAWGTAALSLNGLFIALAHFAVYDVPALAGIALSMWGAARFSTSRHVRWLIVAAVAFALAVICKYGYLLMVVPVLGLLVSTRDLRGLGRTLALFCLVAGAIVTAYFLIFFGSPFPTSMTAYLEQTFQRSRGHIAVLQVVFGLVPFALATAGAVIAWRDGRRILALTCLLALGVYPAFHLWTANFVSGQKHVVPGFLFGYLLAGVALERLWRAGSRVTIGILLAVPDGVGRGAMVLAGAFVERHPTADEPSRAGDEARRADHRRLLLDLHPGALSRGADRISGRRDRCELFAAVDRRDVCQITWLVGNLDTAESVRDGMERCGHRPVLSSVSRHYYFDTSRLRLDAFTTAVTLYQSDGPRQASIKGGTLRGFSKEVSSKSYVVTSRKGRASGDRPLLDGARAPAQDGSGLAGGRIYCEYVRRKN